MKKSSYAMIGIFLTLVGIIAVLRVLGIAHFDLFFRGWWTLLLIVPGVAMITGSKARTMGAVLTICGVILFLGARGWLPWRTAGLLLFPSALIVCGISLVISSLMSGAKMKKHLSENAERLSAVFASKSRGYIDSAYIDSDITTVFGSFILDLRDAELRDKNCVYLTVFAGKTTILLPDNAEVVIRATPVFGGISDKRLYANKSGPKLFIFGNVIFGNVEIIKE